MKKQLQENKDKISTPSYYFDLSEFSNRAERVKSAFGAIPLTYSVKANPFLLVELPECIDRVEACSPGELNICISQGIDPKRIIYSGVNKEVDDIEIAVKYNVEIISAESINQLDQLQFVANKCEIKQKVLLRLSSGNQFGMSKDDIAKVLGMIDVYKDLEFFGFHYYSGTQKSVKQVEEELCTLSESLSEIQNETGFVPELVEVGPGLKVEYFNNDDNKEIDYLNEVSSIINEFSKKFKTGIETGRFLAASCGIYATRVKDIKSIEEINYVICDGGINHLKYHGQNLAMQIPDIEVMKTSAKKEYYCLCGSLCTSADVLVRRVELPALELGDVILFGKCGAYSVTEGLSLFLSRNLPSVYLLTKEHRLVRAREQMCTYELNMYLRK